VRTGRWIAAAALAAALAAGACLWLASEWPRDEGESGARTRDAAVSGAPAAGPTARRAAAPSVATEASDASVEIDDAPLPEGATGTIRGTVRDDLGRPVPRAGIVAFERCVLDSYDVSVPKYAQAGDDGRYVLAGLDPAVVWRLEASADGRADAPAVSAVVLSAQRLDVTYDFVLPRNGGIEAVVLDAAGSPIAHSLRVLSVGRDDSRDFSDAASLPPGQYRVLVDVPDHAGDSRVVTVAAGETTRVEFRAGDAAEISGVLVDSDGSPLRRFEVVAVVADAAQAPFDGTAVTAGDGSFRIAGLRRTPYRLALADLSLVADGPETVVAPATGVMLRLRDDATVTFRLVYPTGFPAADRSAEVAIYVDAHGAGLRPSPRWDFDQCTIRVPGGEDTDLAVIVRHCAAVQRRLRARPNEVLDLGEVRPELMRDVEGRVVDALGRPVGNGVLRFGTGRFGGRTTTGDDGTFRFERLPRSGVAFDVDAAGFVPVRVDCPDDASSLTVTLARAGVLWVHCERTDGAPLAGATVRVADAGGTPWRFAPSALDGHGECAARLPPGRWRITVAGCAPVDADVREGATTSVRLRPAADGR
jgi:hypothetical protein